MKPLAKKAVAIILGYQIRRLRAKNNFKIIGVVGSIGKTSTKLAIARTLSAGMRVKYQDGNYNDIVSVPLIFFGEDMPGLMNIFGWLALFWRNQQAISKTYPYDVVVVEMGSDGPGQIINFKKYLNLEIAVISAITPEHMEYFSNLDAVAKEELAVSKFSSLILANSDIVDIKYLAEQSNLLTYSIDKSGDFSVKKVAENIEILSANESLLTINNASFSDAEIYSLLAATATAYKLGLQPEVIKRGLANIKSVPGRMQKLAGINGSIIIDDSYNASPDAVRLAINALYQMESPQKIALLGNMNELGVYKEDAHRDIGKMCDPKQLDLVVTIGPEANTFLAEEAEARGCKVQRFNDPYAAGEFIKGNIKTGAVILVKGSQNGVFTEEAIKSLLANKADEAKLVRQSQHWLAIKRKAFAR